MSRFGGFFSSKIATSAKHDAWSGEDEVQALQDAMQSAAKIMNDGVEEAEADLKHGISPFHKLGRATAIFFRAVLGFEKEYIEQATARLLEAEESASECQKKALKDPRFAYRSNIYPPGSEYALCHAESQLMLAVVGILNESLMETLRSFQRLRKAFATLHEIVEAEKKFFASNKSSFSTPSSISATSGTQTPAEDEDVFEDAEQEFAEPRTSARYQGHLDLDEDIKKLTLRDRPSGEAELDIRQVTSDPVDLFVHAGTSLCHGLLQILLSMVPPTFSKVLSFFSFQGDRETGMKELWMATNYKHNINGAMAGMVILTFHNTAINLCDMLLPSAYPKARLQSLLDDLLILYPDSKLWPLEQSRMYGFARNIPLAIQTIGNSPPSSLKQLEALRTFERSLNTLFLHDYTTCATLFLSCVGKNDWSHALYYFIAGICHVELYRDTSLPTHAETAIQHFQSSHSSLGRKKFMAKPLPFDAYVSRKLAKWAILTSPPTTSPEEIISRIGPSPVVEMIYFWSGFKKQSHDLLTTSLSRLTKFPPPFSSPLTPTTTTTTTSTANGAAGGGGVREWETSDAAIYHALHGTLLRFLHPDTPSSSQSYLREHVVGKCNVTELRTSRAGKGDTWPLAVAHYESAVCSFLSSNLVEDEREKQGFLEECARELDMVSRFGDGGGSGFELNARVGLKVTQGRETLRRMGVKV